MEGEVMAIINEGTRYKTKTGKKYYISADNTENFETYSVYSFVENSDFDNKTGTLIYTENIRNMKKGATDDLIDDNATLIDEYGSIDFMNTVRNQVIKWVRG
tara:strand:- start:380 stop:685 length:306 start_codon:yes stop_codon:yes gene_type:complete